MDLKTRLVSLRAKLGHRYVNRRLKQKSVTLISDDCWAGQFYESYGVKCNSPFIGMGFTPPEYLNFITHFREPGALEAISVSTKERSYPIIETPFARLFGSHDRSAKDFKNRYERRCRRIDWDHVFIKIDLGRQKYREADIHRWNKLRLPNSVALFPDQPKYHAAAIHNGVCVSDWIEDGAEMFQRSCHAFDVIAWLNSSKIVPARLASLAHYSFFERKMFTR